MSDPLKATLKTRFDLCDTCEMEIKEPFRHWFDERGEILCENCLREALEDVGYSGIADLLTTIENKFHRSLKEYHAGHFQVICPSCGWYWDIDMKFTGDREDCGNCGEEIPNIKDHYKQGRMKK